VARPVRSFIRQSLTDLQTEQFDSAQPMAKALGYSVYEPTWWPDDIGVVTYRIDELVEGPRYKIGSVRQGGVPICVFGGSKFREARLPPEHWHAVPELQSWSGLVNQTDSDCRAVLRVDEQTIHLIGFSNLDELVRAVNSLRPVW
jgi:hypothetical protein